MPPWMSLLLRAEVLAATGGNAIPALVRAGAGACKAPLVYLFDASIEREGLGGLAAALCCDAAHKAFVSHALHAGRRADIERAAIARVIAQDSDRRVALRP